MNFRHDTFFPARKTELLRGELETPVLPKRIGVSHGLKIRGEVGS